MKYLDALALLYSPELRKGGFSEVHPVGKLSHLAVLGSLCSGISI